MAYLRCARLVLPVSRRLPSALGSPALQSVRAFASSQAGQHSQGPRTDSGARRLALWVGVAGAAGFGATLAFPAQEANCHAAGPLIKTTAKVVAKKRAKIIKQMEEFRKPPTPSTTNINNFDICVDTTIENSTLQENNLTHTKQPSDNTIQEHHLTHTKQLSDKTHPSQSSTQQPVLAPIQATPLQVHEMKQDLRDHLDMLAVVLEFEIMELFEFIDTDEPDEHVKDLLMCIGEIQRAKQNETSDLGVLFDSLSAASDQVDKLQKGFMNTKVAEIGENFKQGVEYMCKAAAAAAVAGAASAGMGTIVGLGAAAGKVFLLLAWASGTTAVFKLREGSLPLCEAYAQRAQCKEFKKMAEERDRLVKATRMLKVKIGRLLQEAVHTSSENTHLT